MHNPLTAITMQDFRCFHERQDVVLAPLTILVGENSTGKTSFLALVQALIGLVRRIRRGDRIDPASVFSHPPLDLGSFSEIAHHRGGRAGRADRFTVGSNLLQWMPDGSNDTNNLEFRFEFSKHDNAPNLKSYRISLGTSYIEIEKPTKRSAECYFGNRQSRFRWNYALGDRGLGFDYGLFMFLIVGLDVARMFDTLTIYGELERLKGPELDDDARKQLTALQQSVVRLRLPDIVALAPIRSQPKRTYDPAHLDSAPEGDHIPMLLAHESFASRSRWESIKESLQQFGKDSGLFDELNVKHFGVAGSGPFQIQVRKIGKKRKGPMRNLVDMGYGIGQALPIIAQLIIAESPSLFLIQQPEVHLHPSAQAALGSYLCTTTVKQHQVIVETHGQYLIDRVRTSVRDGKVRSNDVVLLYFERGELEVKIHPIRFDSLGNVVGAPPSYGEFFMREATHSIGVL